MLIIRLQLKDKTYCYKDIVSFYFEEISYLKYKITFIHSRMDKQVEVIKIYKKDLISFTLERSE